MKGLLITYYFPPVNAIASHRVYSFARYLNTGSDQLDVICPDWQGDLMLETGAIKIIKTSAQKYDPNFGEIKLSGISYLKNFVANKIFKLNLFRSRNPGKFYREVIGAIDGINMAEYDYVITSYAPLDCIHAGAYIKQKFSGIKWII